MQKIMFSDKYGLTEAVLEGRKTQTRRIVNFNEIDNIYVEKDLFPISNNRVEPFVIGKYSKYKVGEIVAVAQSYENAGLIPHSLVPKVDGSMIAASNHKGWTNKMFVKPELMPHQIRMKNVRIERLQDISDEDCLAEGIDIRGLIVSPTSMGVDKIMYHFCNINRFYSTPREAYAALIDKVGKKGDWERNPYVFVYDFELVK